MDKRIFMNDLAIAHWMRTKSMHELNDKLFIKSVHAIADWSDVHSSSQRKDKWITTFFRLPDKGYTMISFIDELTGEENLTTILPETVDPIGWIIQTYYSAIPE